MAVVTASDVRPSVARALRVACALLVVMAITGLARPARAAGTAFAVDTSEVSETGSCKVESWISVAGNRDLVATANPACVVEIFRPVELSAQFTRARADDEWGTSLTPKAKTKIVPTQIGNFGLAVAGSTSFDLITGENTTVLAYAPATLRLSETIRINVNGGWLWDRTLDRHYATYGLGLDWKLTDIVTWTIETFGQTGNGDEPGVTQPRFQTGFRIRPIDTFSLDLIYGRNINGEDANWITVGTTIRFPPPGK